MLRGPCPVISISPSPVTESPQFGQNCKPDSTDEPQRRHFVSVVTLGGIGGRGPLPLRLW